MPTNILLCKRINSLPWILDVVLINWWKTVYLVLIGFTESAWLVSQNVSYWGRRKDCRNVEYALVVWKMWENNGKKVLSGNVWNWEVMIMPRLIGCIERPLAKWRGWGVWWVVGLNINVNCLPTVSSGEGYLTSLNQSFLIWVNEII